MKTFEIRISPTHPRSSTWQWEVYIDHSQVAFGHADTEQGAKRQAEEACHRYAGAYRYTYNA